MQIITNKIHWEPDTGGLVSGSQCVLSRSQLYFSEKPPAPISLQWIQYIGKGKLTNRRSSCSAPLPPDTVTEALPQTPGTSVKGNQQPDKRPAPFQYPQPFAPNIAKPNKGIISCLLIPLLGFAIGHWNTKICRFGKNNWTWKQL